MCDGWFTSVKHLHLCYQCQGFWTGRAAPALWPAGWGGPADCTSEEQVQENTHWT